MTKAKLNLIIDAVMMLVMAALAGLGFLMDLVLIPGRERVLRYGRDVELYMLGWDRHDWGWLHEILGLTLLGLLVLHVVLHWGQIVGIYRRLISRAALRKIVAVVFAAVTVLLLLFWLGVSPDVRESTDHGLRGRHTDTEARGEGRGLRRRHGRGRGGRVLTHQTSAPDR